LPDLLPDGGQVALAAAMPPTRDTFVELTAAILERFCAQNAAAVPSAVARRALGEQLWSLVEERGLPPPLAADEPGEPGDLPDAQCAPLLERALAGASTADRATLAVPVRQLIKACFHPEFKICRDSFREVSSDGSCRRQQLTRVRGRVSGAHCIDCPHWVALTPEEHDRFLRSEWLPAGRAELAEHKAIFLPEDFRALRRLLYAHSRCRI
jgi:hypothetical protein